MRLLRDGRPPFSGETIEMAEVWPRWWMPKSTVDWHKRTIFKIQVGVVCGTWVLIALLMVTVGLR